MEIQKTNQQLTNLEIGSKSIERCNYDEIDECLKYIVVLVGIPFEKLPKKEAKQVLVNFIRGYLKTASLEDLKKSFEFAIAKKINIDLSLYSYDFSAKMIVDVYSAYKNYISKLPIENKEQFVNNIEKADLLFKLLKPETLEVIKEIGIEKKEVEIFKPKHYDSHQKWMKQWDFLRRWYNVPETNLIERYGKKMNMDEFWNYKAEQLYRVNEYLTERNTDKLSD